MHNYAVVERNGFFYITELTTDQIVATETDAETAYYLAHHLDGGGGFDSFTPPFFLNKVVAA